CAGDEGDPAQVQGRPPEAERRADEVLQGEPHQPGRVLPAARRAAAGLLRALPRAPALQALPGAGRRPLVAPHRSGHHREGELALVRLPADRGLRPEPGLLELVHVGLDGPDAADPDDVHHADLPADVRAAIPRRARPLLGDDEPLDGRAGPRHPAARAEDAAAAAVRPEADLENPADGAEGRRQGARACPRRCAEAARFQVLEEGNRGLLWVGSSPARVVATAEAGAVEQSPPIDESELAARLRELLTHVTAAIGLCCRIEIEESADTIAAVCSAGDL